MFKLNFNSVIFSLLCIYAFFIPFEHILDIYFGIDTILKPYRVFALLLILFSVISWRDIKFRVNIDFKEDIFLYSVFLYGIIISLIRMIISPFSMGQFFNAVFQTGLYLAVFIILKSLHLNKRSWNTLLWFLVTGISLNAIYLFNNYYILKDFRRQSGFMDNPNFVALSLIASISFLILTLGTRQRLFRKVALAALIVFSLFVFFISGSRTGLLILIILSMLLFLYASTLRKLIMMAGLFAGLLFLVPRSLEEVELGTPNLLFRRVSTLDSSEDPRFPLWRGAIRASVASHFTGLGIGQFKARFPEFYRSENDDMIYRVVSFGQSLSVHSDYFAILTNYGLPGLLFYLTFLLFSFLKIRRNQVSAEDDGLMKIYQFNFMILTSLVIFGIAAEDFNSPIYWFLLAISTKTI